MRKKRYNYTPEEKVFILLAKVQRGAMQVFSFDKALIKAAAKTVPGNVK